MAGGTRRRSRAKKKRLSGKNVDDSDSDDQGVVVVKGAGGRSRTAISTNSGALSFAQDVRKSQGLVASKTLPVNRTSSKRLSSKSSKPDRPREVLEKPEPYLPPPGAPPPQNSGQSVSLDYDLLSKKAQYAQQKRVDLRELGGADGGFVGLGMRARIDDSKLDAGSTLVREEDDDMDIDEFDNPENPRLSFGVAADKEPGPHPSGVAQPRGEGQKQEEDQGSDDEWERQQLLKGGWGLAGPAPGGAPAGAPVPGVTSTLPQGGAVLAGAQGVAADAWRLSGLQSIDQIGALLSGMVARTLPEEVESELHDASSAVKKALAAHEKDLDRAKGELEAQKDSIGGYGKQMLELNRRYKFYQENARFFTDLLDCMETKISQVAVMEGKVNAALRLVHTSPCAIRKDALAYEEDNLYHQHVGRDRPGSMLSDVRRSTRAMQYIALEKEQRSRAETVSDEQMTGFPAGIETIDEKKTIRDVSLSLGAMLDVKAQVFADAGEDFSSLARIAARLESWKEDFYDSYRDSYVSICIPKILSPLVRLEMLGWDALSQPMLEPFGWHKVLREFPVREGSGTAADPDTNLVAGVVAHTVVPLVAAVIRDRFDVFDSASTRQVANLVDEMLVYLDAYPREQTELVRAVESVLARAVNTVLLPEFPRKVLGVPEVVRCYLHRLHRLVALVRNISAMQGVVDRVVLIAFASAVSQQMVTFLSGLTPTADLYAVAESLAQAFATHAWSKGTMGGSALSAEVQMELREVYRRLRGVLGKWGEALGVLNRAFESLEVPGLTTGPSRAKDAAELAERVAKLQAALRTAAEVPGHNFHV